MVRVLLIGTLDTKGAEYAYLRTCLHDAGVETVVMDTGVLMEPEPGIHFDISRDDVATSAGTTSGALIAERDRGNAVSTMGRGAATIATALQRDGKIHAVLALGGSSGSSIAAEAMRALPVGFPKILVSTLAAGDTSPYVGVSDITMMPSVVDVAGINRISAPIFTNAAAAAAGMARSWASFEPPVNDDTTVGATMFGVTTPCVDHARTWLSQRRYEVLVFHATGTGGRTLESLVDDGLVDAVLDVTTTELADDLVGGLLSAGPHRLTAAGRRGIPQVVSVGALDMVNFGPRESVPEAFTNRHLYVHNPTITLMRTTLDECAKLGRSIGSKLRVAKGPVSIFLPLQGMSAISGPGGVFHDQDADSALFEELTAAAGNSVDIISMEANINDRQFAEAMAVRLDEYCSETPGQG